MFPAKAGTTRLTTNSGTTKAEQSPSEQHIGGPFSVKDPHHFDADSEPTFYSDADPDPTFQFDADPDPNPATHFFPDLDPPLLQNCHLRLPPFHFHADPDPTFHFHADLDPDPIQFST